MAAPTLAPSPNGARSPGVSIDAVAPNASAAPSSDEPTSPMSGRAHQGVSLTGGMGLIARLVVWGGAGRPDRLLALALKIHRPVLTSPTMSSASPITPCAGEGPSRTSRPATRRRGSSTASGRTNLPDPTTAGDFCRRFDPARDGRSKKRSTVAPGVWGAQPPVVLRPARAGSTPMPRSCRPTASARRAWTSPTTASGATRLLLHLANTKELAVLPAAGANRPSHEGVVDLYDRAIELCHRGGFTEVLLRGDTDFALAANFDRWDRRRRPLRLRLRRQGEPRRARLGGPRRAIYHELALAAERAITTKARSKAAPGSRTTSCARGFKTLRTAAEDVCEFAYRPGACSATTGSSR